MRFRTSTHSPTLFLSRPRFGDQSQKTATNHLTTQMTSTRAYSFFDSMALPSPALLLLQSPLSAPTSIHGMPPATKPNSTNSSLFPLTLNPSSKPCSFPPSTNSGIVFTKPALSAPFSVSTFALTPALQPQSAAVNPATASLRARSCSIKSRLSLTTAGSSSAAALGVLL
jgi:hypothetical protein